MNYHRMDIGDGTVWVDEETLEPIEIKPYRSNYPSFVDSVTSPHEGMVVNKVFDTGKKRGHS